MAEAGEGAAAPGHPRVWGSPGHPRCRGPAGGRPGGCREVGGFGFLPLPRADRGPFPAAGTEGCGPRGGARRHRPGRARGTGAAAGSGVPGGARRCGRRGARNPPPAGPVPPHQLPPRSRLRAHGRYTYMHFLANSAVVCYRSVTVWSSQCTKIRSFP